MNLGQTLLATVALMMLSIVILGYYSSVAQRGRDVTGAKAGITATTIATSFVERVQNTHFDCVTDTCSDAITNVNVLTQPINLGREPSDPPYPTIEGLDDFDDFNRDTIDYPVQQSNEVYKVAFRVYYVDTTSIDSVVTARPTYLKRMDIAVWRTFPPIDRTNASLLDSVKISTVRGYFFFNPL
jgi:hypothetical protein